MIASLKVPSVGLAPMEGVTDFPFRTWMRLAGDPDYLCTPFLRATATFPDKTLPALFAPELTDLKGQWHAPLIAQVMASCNDHFERAAHLFLEHTGSVDINCGCPSPSPFGSGAGSSLLSCSTTFVRRQEDLVARLGKDRLGVKMRTGVETDAAFGDMIDGLANLPLRRLTVHARTKVQGYKGKADWRHIAYAANKSVSPVLGSGDVTDAKMLRDRLTLAPKVSSIIVGRGALRNPWIFSEIRLGKIVEIELDALLYSLAVFALLHEIYINDPEHVTQRTALLPRKACDTDLEAWQHCFSQLSKEHSLFELQLHRRSLGRVKQLWGYLRSSLPEPYFEPQILRAKSVGELLQRIAAIAGRCDTVLPLVYRPELDWLYAGEGHGPAARSIS